MNTRYTGNDPTSGRELVLLDVRSHADIPLPLDCKRNHICGIAWDADNALDVEIRSVAQQIIHRGCGYICCWGIDCERVHDIFDEEWLEHAGGDLPFISTWHESDSLEKFVWYTMFTAEPFTSGDLLHPSLVAIAIDNGENAGLIENAFKNPPCLGLELLGRLMQDNNTLHAEPRVAWLFLLACLSLQPGERGRYRIKFARCQKKVLTQKICKS